MTTANRYQLPSRHRNPDGAVRRVGFELEFAGLEFRRTTAVLAQALGHPASPLSEAEATVAHPELGTFRIEVDHQVIKSLARKWARWREDFFSEYAGRDPGTEDPLAEWLVNLTTEVVPVEVVCPPIAMDRMNALDPMIDALRGAGALGTSESLLYAFGLHINPELPSLDAAVIGRYLRAYAIAQDWLVDVQNVDLTRRLTPFIDLFGNRYRTRVAAYDDNVTLDTLIGDYLHFNDTRNRALDMLPLFCHLDEARIRAAVDDPRIKPRPTLHYRMPDCRINLPGWSLADSWNIWCAIEALTVDTEMLRDLCEQFLAYGANLINLRRPPWHQTLDKLLRDLASA